MLKYYGDLFKDTIFLFRLFVRVYSFFNLEAAIIGIELLVFRKNIQLTKSIVELGIISSLLLALQNLYLL